MNEPRSNLLLILSDQIIYSYFYNSKYIYRKSKFRFACSFRLFQNMATLEVFMLRSVILKILRYDKVLLDNSQNPKSNTDPNSKYIENWKFESPKFFSKFIHLNWIYCHATTLPRLGGLISNQNGILLVSVASSSIEARETL